MTTEQRSHADMAIALGSIADQHPELYDSERFWLREAAAVLASLSDSKRRPSDEEVQRFADASSAQSATEQNVRWVPVAASIAITRVNEVTIGLDIFGHDQEGQWYRLDGHIEEPK